MPLTTGISQLTFRQDYFGDPAAFAGLVALLHETFGIDVSLQDRFGGPDPTSMPFAYFDESGICVANLSAFSMPMMVDGRLVKAAGFQSGAVRPQWRGQGLYRDLMRRAFSWCDAQGFELGLLLTDKPALSALWVRDLAAAPVLGVGAGGCEADRRVALAFARQRRRLGAGQAAVVRKDAGFLDFRRGGTGGNVSAERLLRPQHPA